MADGSRVGSEPGLARRTGTVLGVVVLVAGAIALAGAGLDVVLLAVASVLFAIFLSAPTRWLQDRLHVRRGVALAIVLAVLLAAFGAVAVALGAQIVEQVRALIQELPQRIREAQAWLRETALGQKALDMMPSTDEMANGGGAGQAAKNAAGVATGVADLLWRTLFVVFAGVYLAAEPRVYREGFVGLLPPPRRERAREVLQEIGQELGRWLVGRAVSMVLVGIASTLGLLALGVPMAIGLGALAAALDFVPNVGPILAAVPAVALALSEGPDKALAVAGLYMGIQLLEGFVITPLVERRSVQLPPALLLTFQVLLGTVFGGMALALATPVLVCVIVATRMLYVEDVLGERSGGTADAT